MAAASTDRLVSNLNVLLRTLNISQAELARRARIPQTTLNRIFHSKDNPFSPNLRTLDSLARGLKVSIAELFGSEPGEIEGHITDLPRMVSRQVARLVKDFLLANGGDRTEILRFAEDRANRAAMNERKRA